MYKKYCDRCDKEIPDYTNHVEIRLKETLSHEEFEEDELHLCHDCHIKFKSFMANRKTKQEAMEKSTEYKDQNVVPSLSSIIRDPIDNSL